MVQLMRFRSSKSICNVKEPKISKDFTLPPKENRYDARHGSMS